jgi:hypothetical protein
VGEEAITSDIFGFVLHFMREVRSYGTFILGMLKSFDEYERLRRVACSRHQLVRGRDSLAMKEPAPNRITASIVHRVGIVRKLKSSGEKHVM